MYFKKYKSKPIIRKAYKIKDSDSPKELTTNLYRLHGIDFQAYEDILPGSYVVYLNDSDVYHCNEEVFKERNIT